jgi:hypothetical protein
MWRNDWKIQLLSKGGKAEQIALVGFCRHLPAGDQRARGQGRTDAHQNHVPRLGRLPTTLRLLHPFQVDRPPLTSPNAFARPGTRPRMPPSSLRAGSRNGHSDRGTWRSHPRPAGDGHFPTRPRRIGAAFEAEIHQLGARPMRDALSHLSLANVVLAANVAGVTILAGLTACALTTPLPV